MPDVVGLVEMSILHWVFECLKGFGMEDKGLRLTWVQPHRCRLRKLGHASTSAPSAPSVTSRQKDTSRSTSRSLCRGIMTRDSDVGFTRDEHQWLWCQELAVSLEELDVEHRILASSTR